MKSKKSDSGGLVYSTAHGRMCPNCGKPKGQCICKKKKGGGAKSDGIVRVGRETKGRKGKGVTVITGLPGSADALRKLASELKAKCGSGGTVKDRVIEIQGEHRDVLVAELTKRGYTVKRAGG